MNLFEPRHNHGREFPAELDLRDPDAKRGTLILRGIDRELVVGFNRRRHVYEIYAPSLSAGGWVHCVDAMNDQGRPLRSPVPWQDVAFAIKDARDSELTPVERVAQHNARLADAEDRRLRQEAKEKVAYVRPAIRAETLGASRHSTDDVMQALKNAENGTTKAPAKGQKFSLPGEAVK